MKEVDISWNELDDDMTEILSTCLHNVEELCVRKCQLTPTGIETIFNAIREKTIPVI